VKPFRSCPALLLLLASASAWRCQTIRSSSNFSAKCPSDDNATDDAGSRNWNIHSIWAFSLPNYFATYLLDSSWSLVTEVLQDFVESKDRLLGTLYLNESNK
jgi:hypothetical protein